MALKLGSADVAAVYLGSVSVAALILGAGANLIGGAVLADFDAATLTDNNGSALTEAAVSAVAAPARWDAYKGVNLTSLYRLTANGSDPIGFGPTAYADAAANISNATLNAIKASGLQFVRLVINTAPLFEAYDQGNTSRIATYLADINTLIDRVRTAGLKAIWDNHVDTANAKWAWTAVFASKSLTDPKFLTVIAVLKLVAAAIASYPASDVALEMINEPPEEARVPGLNAVWNSFMKAVYDGVRPLDASRTLIVSGSEVGNITALVGNTIDKIASAASYVTLDPTVYDRNTLFSVHYYDPHFFSHCGAPFDTLGAGYCDGMNFPFQTNGVVNTAERDSVIANAQTAIQADNTLADQAAKDAMKTSVAAAVTNMYANFDVKYANDLTSASPNANAGRITLPMRWADYYGVDRSRILFGEFGAYMGTKGVTLAGRAAWYTLVRNTIEAQGHRWSVWNWDEQGSFAIADASNVIPTSIKTALGLV